MELHRIVVMKVGKNLKDHPNKRGGDGGKGVSLLLTFAVLFCARIREMRLERQYPLGFKRVEEYA